MNDKSGNKSYKKKQYAIFFIGLFCVCLSLMFAGLKLPPLVLGAIVGGSFIGGCLLISLAVGYKQYFGTIDHTTLD